MTSAVDTSIFLQKQDCQDLFEKYVSQGILPNGSYLSDPDYMYAAYNQDKIPVGIVCLVIDDDDDDVVWSMNSLAVDKNYQRRGYATAIVNKLIEMCRESNPSCMLCYSISYDDIPALLDFYAKYKPVYTGMEAGEWGGFAEFCIDCRLDKTQPNPHIIGYYSQYDEPDYCEELQNVYSIVSTRPDYYTYKNYASAVGRQL